MWIKFLLVPFRIELSFIYLLLEALLTFLDFARQFLLLATRQFCTFMRLLKILRLLSCYHRLIQRRRNPWRKKFFLWRMALLSYAAFRFQLFIIHTVCVIGPVMDGRQPKFSTGSCLLFYLPLFSLDIGCKRNCLFAKYHHTNNSQNHPKRKY